MEEISEGVEDVLRQAKFGGKYTRVKITLFDDMSYLHAFLSMTKDQG